MKTLPPPDYHPVDFAKACHVLWTVEVEGATLTHAAIVNRLNVGQVWRVVHRLYPKFVDAFPVRPPDRDQHDDETQH